MCRNGVNLTQFKLSAHQLKRFAEALEESLKQWEDTLSPLGFAELSRLAGEARAHASAAASSIETLLAAAAEAEASDSGITITPL